MEPAAPATPPAPRGVRPRDVLVVVGIVLAVGASLWLLWLTRRIILWILIAMFLAMALNPAVDFLVRRLRFRKVLAITTVYVLGLAAVAGIAWLFIPPLIDAGQQLVDDVPGYVEDLKQNSFFADLQERYDLLTRIEDAATSFGSGVGAGDALGFVSRIFTGVLGAVTVLVLTFFFLIYGGRLREQVLAVLPSDVRGRYRGVADRMYRTVGGYVTGNLVVSLIAGVAGYVALTIMGVPSALALAFWVALTDLVPLVGATIGAIPCVIVAFFQGWPVGVAAIVYFLVYQQVENHLIQPQVMRRTTELNALLVLVAVLFGAQLLGVLGALVAIPVAGMIMILVQDWIEHRFRARGLPGLTLDRPP
ncbi:MAG: AI-2E family transporter, partial [Actinomycetota bacterium]